jgi:hypothetical protein
MSYPDVNTEKYPSFRVCLQSYPSPALARGSKVGPVPRVSMLRGL